MSNRQYGARFVPPTSAPPPDPPPMQITEDSPIIVTIIQDTSLKIMTKDEFVLYNTTGKWEGNSKEHALKMFEKASKGHEFVFYMHSKEHTYSADYIDRMLKRG